jgi:DnaJ-class molecular chaperone
MSNYWIELDFYQLLEVPRAASASEIKSQRDFLVAIWHPDRVPEKYRATATERTSAINEAYKELSNEKTRNRYNLSLPPAEDDLPVFGDSLQNVPGVWKAMSAWMKDEDVGTTFLRTMAYTAGDYLERRKQPSDKQLRYMEDAWKAAVGDGFDPGVDGLGR